MTIEITKGSENSITGFFSSPSRTPDTDDLARGNHVVPVEWAEQLERERDEANEELSKKYVEYDQLFDAAEKIKIERDEARRKYDELATEHMLVVNKLCKERDDALKGNQ